MNNTTNINYLFYRKYFEFEKSDLSKAKCITDILNFNKDFNERDLNRLENNKLNILRNIEELKSINKSILRYPLQKIDFKDCYKDTFILQTVYPGLLMGTGYSHDYKASDEDITLEGFKIGFYFDFTTGMPVIPGSSVKGLLRSCFPQRVVKSKNKKNKKPKHSTEKEKFIKSELVKLGVKENIDIDILECEIFDGRRPQKDENNSLVRDEKGRINYKPFSVYQRDLFFEAIPMKVNNTKKVLFEDDSLAVHGENLLKNPIPIKFLKVAPGVQYQFNFKLFNSVFYPNITAEIKLKLFRQILLTIGIGAKTNVGYGQFKEV